MEKLENANFSILHLTNEISKYLTPVTSLDIYENNSDNFHDDGLFSTKIFGRIGDPLRDRRFSYIDIKIEILHPLIFRNIIKLKKFYHEIIKGNAYAVFDNETNDFIPSDVLNGDTGYNFFLTYFDKIKFKRNDSKQRNNRIDFIEKYRKVAKTDKVLVLPAGLRDIQPDPDGRDQEGEINTHYRKLITVANALNRQTNLNSKTTDSARLGLQNAFNAIYSYIIQISKGKGGFILRKWASRAVFNSTRSVLSGAVPNINNVSDNNYPGWNNTAIGIGQLLKGLLPVAVHKVISHPLVLDSFPTNDNTALLLDTKTLERVRVNLSNKTTDKWTTQAGIESLIDNFMEHSVRSSFVTIEGHYLGLIYRDKKNGFKILSDIKEAEQYEWMDKDNIHPITWVEFFYLMGYQDWNKYPMLNTRYPISGAGSIYPSFVFCKTTVDSEVRYELDNDGNIIKENKAISFPILKDATFVDSLSISPSRIGAAGADAKKAI